MTDTTIATTEDMTEEEGERLIELEREVDKAMRAAGRICGTALAEIRDRRLYRASHASFGAYCLDRLDLSKSTAYRMIAGAGLSTNGLPPAAVAIGQASAKAAERRHTTLDQPPATIDPPSEPLQVVPERPTEPEEAPEPPKIPEARLIPPSPFQQSELGRIKGGREGAPPNPERAGRIAAREGLNKVLAALDGALCSTTEAAMAEVATPTERLRLAKLGAAITVEDRKTRKPEGVVDPKDCDHPVGRIIGRQCGKCGAAMRPR